MSQLVGITVGLPHKSLAQANDVTIVGTSYLDQVAEKLKHPGVTTEQAVEYANDLLSKNGFDYDFDACPIVKANQYPEPVDKHGVVKIYKYYFVQTNGHNFNIQLNGSPTEALCGECAFTLPLLRVTKRELVVVSGGKRYTLKRPPGFLLKEIYLVDQSMKYTLRTWEVPLDTQRPAFRQMEQKSILSCTILAWKISLIK